MFFAGKKRLLIFSKILCVTLIPKARQFAPIPSLCYFDTVGALIAINFPPMTNPMRHGNLAISVAGSVLDIACGPGYAHGHVPKNDHSLGPANEAQPILATKQVGVRWVD